MRKTEYLAIGETLYRDTLPGGLRLVVAVKPGYARRCAILATDYGGADRRFRSGDAWTDTPMGVAHYLEHKMFEMPDGDAMFAMAASGAQPNAFTSSCMTAYYFDCTEHFEKNLRSLIGFVTTPYFPAESVEKERGIITQEILMTEDEPDYKIYIELLKSLYEHHPVREAVVGTVESIQAITPAVLQSCYDAFYHPGNMTLIVVGDVDPEQVRAIAAETLSREEREPPVRDYGPAETLTPSRRRFRCEAEVSAPQFILGCALPCPAGGEALLRQKLVAELALSCLYRQTSPFFTRLYEDGLLNTDFYTVIDDAAGTSTLLAGGESREPERVFEAFVAEAQKAAENGLDAKAFERTKRAFYGKSVRGLANFFALSENLAEAEFRGYDFPALFPMLESVTAEEVRRFLAEALRPERFSMSVAEPIKNEVTSDA